MQIADKYLAELRVALQILESNSSSILMEATVPILERLAAHVKQACVYGRDNPIYDNLLGSSLPAECFKHFERGGALKRDELVEAGTVDQNTFSVIPLNPTADLTSVIAFHFLHERHDLKEVRFVLIDRTEKKAVLGGDAMPLSGNQNEPVGGMLFYHANGVALGKSKLAELCLEPIGGEHPSDLSFLTQKHIRTFETIWALAHQQGMSMKVQFFKSESKAA